MATYISENIQSEGGITAITSNIGTISATTITGVTFFGNGSNLSNISAGAFTGGTVTGTTTFTNGLTANTISGGTFFGNGSSITNISATFNGGTVTGATNFTNGLTANTISATTITGTTLFGDATNLTNVVRDSTSDIGNCPTTTSTQTITHGLGRTPKKIRIQGIATFASSASATPTTFSIGNWTSSGNRCIYMAFGAAITTAVNGASSNTFAIRLYTTSGAFNTGVIQNVTSTSFDISWTITGAPAARVYVWEAE